MEGDGQDGLEQMDRRVAEMIGEAILAGAYRELIRRLPETAGGFGKLADKHSARVAALAADISAGVGRLNGRAPARRHGLGDR